MVLGHSRVKFSSTPYRLILSVSKFDSSKMELTGILYYSFLSHNKTVVDEIDFLNKKALAKS